MFFNALSNVTVILFMVAIGAIAGYKKFINDEVNLGINKILMNIGLPFLIFSSFKVEYNTKDIYGEMLLILISFCLIKLILIVISHVVFRKEKDKFYSSNWFSSVFSNSSFMGLPIVSALFGEKALIYISIYIIFLNILSGTIGISFFKGKIDRKGLLGYILNPIIIFASLGLILFMLKIKLPFVLTKTMSTVGSITTPLSFLSLGYSLTKFRLIDIFKGKREYIACFIKLIIGPSLVILLLSIFIKQALLLNTLTIIEAMPVPTVGIIYTNIYKTEDTGYLSRVVFLSTILSLITIPIFSMFLK